MKKTGKRLSKALFLFLFFFTSTLTSLSEEGILNVSASVDAAKIGLLDTLELAVTVEAENTARFPDPQLPDLKFFTIINQSTQTQTKISIINGKTTRTKTLIYNYTLQPKNKGTFTVDPISLKYKGEIFQTDPITISVAEGHVKSSEPDFPFDVDLEIDLSRLKEDIFILVKPETSNIYEGQQLLLTYTLYSRIDIDSITHKDSPDFQGFYKEDIFNATRLEYRKETYNSNIYNATLLKKIALFPINPGKYTTKPLVLEITVILKSDELFTFFGRPYTFLIKSNDLTINVNPLLENTTGERFTYIVGELTADISKRENMANTGESTTCYLTLKSTGNLGSISDPGIQLSKRGRVYLSETTTDQIEEYEKIYFIKKFEYTIIPEESGLLDISTNDLLYYDITEDNYVFVHAEPAQIRITGKDIYQEKPIIGSKKTSAEGGFNYIKQDVKILKNASSSPLNVPFYYFYHLILIAGTGIMIFIKLKRESLQKNEDLFRKKKAKSYAMDIMKNAKQALSEGNYYRSIDLINQALSTYIANKCGKTPQEITMKNVRLTFEQINFASDSIQNKIVNILVRCTAMKFSKERINEKMSVETLYNETISLIHETESYRPLSQWEKERKEKSEETYYRQKNSEIEDFQKK